MLGQGGAGALKQLGAVRDPGDQLPHLMSGGEQAVDRLQLALGALALGDIAVQGHGADDRPLGVPHGGDRGLDLDGAPVLVTVDHVSAPDPMLEIGTDDRLAIARLVHGLKDLQRRPANGLLGRPAVDLLGRPVPAANDPVRVCDDQRVGERGEQAGVVARLFHHAYPCFEMLIAVAFHPSHHSLTTT
jgi:hypothetical protein